MNKVTIQTRLSLQDFVSANYALLLRKASTKLLLLMAAAMIVLPVVIAVRGAAPYKSSLLQSLIGIGLIAFYALSTYFAARKNYKSMPGISDPLTYEFTDQQLTCTGASASSQSTWEKVFKVTETKKSILIWRSSQIVNVIPKRDITPEQLRSLKEMVIRNKVKSKFKD